MFYPEDPEGSRRLRFPVGLPNVLLIPIPSSLKSNILHGMYLKSDKIGPRCNHDSTQSIQKQKQKINISIGIPKCLPNTHSFVFKIQLFLRNVFGIVYRLGSAMGLYCRTCFSGRSGPGTRGLKQDPFGVSFLGSYLAW